MLAKASLEYQNVRVCAACTHSFNYSFIHLLKMSQVMQGPGGLPSTGSHRV